MSNNAILSLRAGEWVEVRTKGEILSTLDANGRLDELPFMPEMLQYCGRRLQVGKRAHKTCDPALGTVGRQMRNAVHLENLRCNGSAHDGCEARCLLFWKEAWLRRVDAQADSVEKPANGMPTLVYAGRPFGIGARDVLGTVGPPMAAGLITVVIGLTAQQLFLADYSRLARLTISTFVCLVAYFTVAVGVFRVTGPIQLGLSLLHDFTANTLAQQAVVQGCEFASPAS